jgi:hypothetical protein
VNAYPVEGRLEKAKDPLFGLAMGEASQISSDSFRFVIKGFYYNLVSDLFCTVAWLSVVKMCLSFYTVGSIHKTAYASKIFKTCIYSLMGLRLKPSILTLLSIECSIVDQNILHAD